MHRFGPTLRGGAPAHPTGHKNPYPTRSCMRLARVVGLLVVGRLGSADPSLTPSPLVASNKLCHRVPAATARTTKRGPEGPGACQGGCRRTHAASGCLFNASAQAATTDSRSGLSVTGPTGEQSRVEPDQRAGFSSRALRNSSWRAARMATSSPAWRWAGLT